jgi:putative endonuclease
MDERKRRGDRGEEAVASLLRQRGYEIVERQYRCRAGEIDLIARSGDGTVCFVEVKSRASDRFAQAREFVTPAKQRRLRLTAGLYLAQEQLDCPCRFDVAEVYPGPKGWEVPKINYITGAF